MQFTATPTTVRPLYAWFVLLTDKRTIADGDNRGLHNIPDQYIQLIQFPDQVSETSVSFVILRQFQKKGQRNQPNETQWVTSGMQKIKSYLLLMEIYYWLNYME